MFGRRQYTDQSDESLYGYESTGIRSHLIKLESNLFNLKEIVPIFDVYEIATRGTRHPTAKRFVPVRYYCAKTMFTPSRLIEWAWIEAADPKAFRTVYTFYKKVAETFGKQLGTFTIYSSANNKPITPVNIEAFGKELNRSPVTNRIFEKGVQNQYESDHFFYFVIDKNSPYPVPPGTRAVGTKKCAAENRGLESLRTEEIADYEKMVKKDDARQKARWGKHVYNASLPPETYYKRVVGKVSKVSPPTDSAIRNYYY